MTTPTERLNRAAYRLDHLYEGAKHIPTDLFHDRDFRVGLVNSESHEPGPSIAQFYWGGAAEVFLALGPAVLPMLAKLLREEARNVAMSESINGLLAQNRSDAQPSYLASALAALAFADHILNTEEK